MRTQHTKSPRRRRSSAARSRRTRRSVRRRRPRQQVPQRTAAEQQADAVRVERQLADVLSPKVVDRLRDETGYNPRQRKATALCVLLIVVQAFLMGQALSFARLRALFIARFENIRPRAFQLRFKSAAAVTFFRAAFAEAVHAVVSAAEIRLEGALASFADVQVYDGTAVRVPPRGKQDWPASHDDRAGAKLLLGYSLKTGVVERAAVAAETTGELPLWRKLVPTLERNVLYLLDLAYFDREIFEHAQSAGAHVLLRLKSKSKLWVVGHQTRQGYVGLPRWSLATYLAGAASARGTTYDLDVIWGKGRHAVRLRLVGVSLGGRAGRRFYLTTVPRSRLSVTAVVEAYRLRWLIELLNREIKQEADMGRCDTADPHAVAALAYGALIGHVVLRSLRICAALRAHVPLTELRPLASLHLVRAFAVAAIDVLATHDLTAWHRLVESIAPLLVAVAHEATPSRSRPRIAFDLGALGG